MRTGFFISIGVFIVLGFQPIASEQEFDVIIRNGTIYDGTGSQSFIGDIGIQQDTIASIGNLKNARGKQEIDAAGLAVAPGFINMLSWGDQNLLKDGRAMSDIKQGVTLEVFGEGWSPGPMKRKTKIPVDSLWTTLDGYFNWLMKKGCTPNVASFIGQTSIRNYVMNHDNREPTSEELIEMKLLVHQGMEDGAMGLGTSLIYPPAAYASTEELIALAKVVSKYGGMYITHMRSEGDFILIATNETLRIAKEANVHAEIYHLKINIARNWNKIDPLLFKIDSAQKSGIKITANMYPYIASGTGLTSRLPAWVQEGGAKEMRKRLRNPDVRKKVLFEMKMGIPYKNSDPSNVVMMGFRLDSLNTLYKGKRLNDVARLHGKNADETTLDLILRDKSRIEAIYYLQSEDNLKKIIRLPYVSFGSDAGAEAMTKETLEEGTHPRMYGTFARVLGQYVRNEKLVSLEEAIRKLTSLPASNLKIRKRGSIKIGHYADLAIFNPLTIQDLATFEKPKQYAIGMVHVFVNGVHVLNNGEHTLATPGRVVRGPGYKIK